MSTKRKIMNEKPENLRSQTHVATIDSLREAIEFIDALSQQGDEEVSALAEAALNALEHPDTCLDYQLIGKMLELIKERSNDIMNSINSEAESLGCNHKVNGDRAHRRHEAQRTAMRERTQ